MCGESGEQMGGELESVTSKQRNKNKINNLTNLDILFHIVMFCDVSGLGGGIRFTECHSIFEIKFFKKFFKRKKSKVAYFYFKLFYFQ